MGTLARPLAAIGTGRIAHPTFVTRQLNFDEALGSTCWTHSLVSRYAPRLNCKTTQNTKQGTTMDYTFENISKMIDHSLLNPTMTSGDLEAGIRLALAYDVASVCIMPYGLKQCADMLADSTVKASTTIGFPHGGHTTSTKLAEADRAIADGCEELDLVINISKALSGDWDYVRTDIQAVIEAAHAAQRKVKVIFENCYLNDDQKIRLCAICGELDADWVKTSTGYGTSGAKLEDLVLMRKHSPDRVQVKAAGGVRDLDCLLEIRSIGVTRIGSSRTAELLDDCRRRLNLSAIEIADVGPTGY
jgi:deoxyribose-phosphate aldolase